MKVTLIHNPDAGDDQQPFSNELLGLIRRAGHTVSYQSSKDESWQSALEQSCDIVAVAGGDSILGTGACLTASKISYPTLVLPSAKVSIFRSNGMDLPSTSMTKYGPTIHRSFRLR